MRIPSSENEVIKDFFELMKSPMSVRMAGLAGVFGSITEILVRRVANDVGWRLAYDLSREVLTDFVTEEAISSFDDAEALISTLCLRLRSRARAYRKEREDFLSLTLRPSLSIPAPADAATEELDYSPIVLQNQILLIQDTGLYKSFTSLTPEEQDILAQFVTQENDGAIAAELQVSKQVVRRRITRALANLKTRYQEGQTQRTDSGLILLPEPSIQIIKTWKEIVKAIAMDIRYVDSMGWKKFEDLVAHLLESFGWSITPMGYTKDGGIDLIAVRSNAPDVASKMIVQCKKYNTSLVGVSHVCELYAIKSMSSDFNHAMIATTSGFTKGARDSASLWNLQLRNREAILRWCQELTTRG